ncbi:MAG: 2-succinyl-5-enolpyruvyl-6-hydroxy-3-cyclohexene-1-carboxylic-acid synthase, partial [Maribacter sp.]
VQHCQAKDISNIVISPGSRNAPLTISFTENPFFNCFSIVDERCAAFFALGMAQQLGKPVGIVCTSGSALLNYYPAIAEAFYSQIPLVVISADRPPYKIDIGDGQTIRQDDVFNRHIGYSANLKQDVSHATDKIKRYCPERIPDKDLDEVQRQVQSFNDEELNKVINLSINENVPVHINVPFEEPLYDFLPESSIDAEIEFEEAVQNGFTQIDKFRETWHQAKRKIILVGVNQPNSVDVDLLDILGKDPTVLVFTETTSNLHHSNFFNSIDTMIAPIELSENREELFQELKPEIVLTFGGLIVSKKIKAFLRIYKPDEHWHVGGIKANDTFFCLNKHIKISVNDFLSKLYTGHNNVESNFADSWNKIKDDYKVKRKEYITKIPFSDFLVFNTVLNRIPTNYQLQLANSSTIRYTQLFDLEPSLKVFCNRGTSGIDGSTSTAIGASLAVESPTLLITGDLSFFYDSNALWNNYTREDFRIILINNGGGGIFRILPGKEDSENFENYFETKHDLNASALCAMYGLGYQKASDKKSLEKELESFYMKSDNAMILEIFTPRLINNKILMDYFHFIS